MIRSNITPERVYDLFHNVVGKEGFPAVKFEKSKHIYWKMNDDGTITHGPSILWLFCWAHNGMGSWRAAASAEKIFNQIFPFSYDEFLATVGYEYSRENRYKLSETSGKFIMNEIKQKMKIDL